MRLNCEQRRNNLPACGKKNNLHFFFSSPWLWPIVRIWRKLLLFWNGFSFIWHISLTRMLARSLFRLNALFHCSVLAVVFIVRNPTSCAISHISLSSFGCIISMIVRECVRAWAYIQMSVFLFNLLLSLREINKEDAPCRLTHSIFLFLFVCVVSKYIH